jgi:uncharacterized protein
MTYSPSIVRRDLHFDMQDDIPRYWLDGDAHKTRYFDALSLMFPDGERFFIDSVRTFRPDIAGDAELDAAVGGFIGQEAMHSREHLVYNERLQRQGVDAYALMQIVKDVQDRRARTLPPVSQLALTICLEHFTAMLADHLLRHPSTLQKADPRMVAIWRWHALEETEHKAVSFDVWNTVMAPGPKRYLIRIGTYLLTTLTFWPTVFLIHTRLIRSDRTADQRVRGMGRVIGFLDGPRHGVFPRIAREWLSFFRPDFHPWDHDNRHHLAKVAQLVAENEARQAAWAEPSVPAVRRRFGAA